MTVRARSFRLEAVKNDAAASEAKAKVYKFRANDGDWDRYQDRISVGGWKLDAFNANPVILFNHDAGDGGFLGLGRKDVLPIGKGRAYVEGDALMVDIEFDQTDEFAKKVESKVEQGILNAVSVRYVMSKYHENERGGYDCDEQELLEISVVTIPGNQRALRVKALSADEQELFDAFAARVAQKFAEKQPAAPREEQMDPEQIKKMQAELEALKAEKAAAAAKAAEEALAQKVADLAAAKIMEQSKGNREPAVAAAPTVQVGERVAKKAGIDFARFVKAQAVAKMNSTNAVEVLKGWGYNDTAKALSSGSFSGMGSLVRPELAADFIELLRNEAVIRKAGARVVPMGASLDFGGQATAASAAYSGETSTIASSNPTTSKPLVLSEKKLTAQVYMPNDLIRNASESAEAFVRDDLLRVMALKEDLKFLTGSGGSYEPLGLKSQLASSHTYSMTALASAGVPTVAEIKKEIAKAKKRLKLSNAPMRNMVWIMSPSVEAAILQAISPGSDGTNMYEQEMSLRGTLAGWPYFVTNQLTETSTVDLFAFDMSEVIIGESMALELETFPNGAFHDGSSVVSGITTDQTVIRAISKHDIGLRHNVSGINVTGVTWGI